MVSEAGPWGEPCPVVIRAQWRELDQQAVWDRSPLCVCPAPGQPDEGSAVFGRSDSEGWSGDEDTIG